MGTIKDASYQLTKSTLTITYANGEYVIIPRQDPRFKKVLKLINSGAGLDSANLKRVVDPMEEVASWSKGCIKFNADSRDYVMEYDGTRYPINEALAKVMLDFVKEEYPVDPFAKFVVRLMSNPSMRSRNTFYGFMENNGISITSDGMVRGYKAIRNDWTDKFTGKISNKIGVTVPAMSRSEVDDDPSNACSYGYHWGGIDYVTSFACGYGLAGGDRIVLVEVDPANIVTVPNDCSQGKVRCTVYTVVGEYTGKLPSYADAVYKDATDESEMTIEEYMSALNHFDDDDEDDDVSDYYDDECVACGSELDSDASYKYCPFCGTEL